MRASLLEIIRCPVCGSGALALAAAESDALEVRAGAVTCAGCGASHPIQGGVLDLLPNPSAAIVSEQQGWERLRGELAADIDEQMLALPYLADPLWQNTARNFDDILRQVDLRGRRVLDIGSGRAWSARRMALAGAEVVASDVLRLKYLGLDTADLFLGRDGCFFERVLCDMEALPFHDASFDVVFSTASLHHALDLGAAFRALRRVLRPGGLLLLVNEPVIRLGEQHSFADSPEVAAGINEHIYTVDEWLDAAHQAGFDPRLRFAASTLHAARAGRAAELAPGRRGAFLQALLDRPAHGWTERTASVARIYRRFSLPLTMVARAADEPAAVTWAPDDGDLFLELALAAEGDVGQPGADPSAEIATLHRSWAVDQHRIVQSSRPRLAAAINAFQLLVRRATWWYTAPQWLQVNEFHGAVVRLAEALVGQQRSLSARLDALEQQMRREE